MSDEATEILALKIARLLQTETAQPDFYSLQKNIEKISERLENIETTLSFQNSQAKNFPNLHSFSLPHPSQEKFDVAEIFADAKDENYAPEKSCPYEPTGKPCDHCSMCNSRGF